MDHPALTRQALCAQAEALAVALVRWKVWRVEGHPDENLQEAQAMQALALALVELLDERQGSPAAVHTELARAVSLLGYTLEARGAGTAPQPRCPPTDAPGDDAAFLRTHGLRFSETAPAEDPSLEP